MLSIMQRNENFELRINNESFSVLYTKGILL